MIIVEIKLNVIHVILVNDIGQDVQDFTFGISHLADVGSLGHFEQVPGSDVVGLFDDFHCVCLLVFCVLLSVLPRWIRVLA